MLGGDGRRDEATIWMKDGVTELMADHDRKPAPAEAAVEHAAAQIEAWNPHVNAMMAVDDEGARKTAEEIDQRMARGDWPGLLAGMTLAIKDNIDTAGLETTSGSNFFKGRVPNRDAPVISRLKQAGGVLVGKATLHEVCFGVRSHNALIGQCRNPYDTSIIPGGSSGGSAVAVATGMADGALGSDTGGSVRIPASICGVTGLRPTTGRVANTGSLAVSDSHDTIGPMARSALDVARLFAVIAGYDDGDPMSVDQPLINFLPRLGDGISGLTIGLPKAYFYDDLDGEVARAVDEALQTFEALGATLTDIDLAGAAETFDQAATIIFSDAAALHAERLDEPAKWGQQTIERLKMGLEFSGCDYARSMRAREVWRRTLKRAFEAVDMIALPTLPQLPPPINDDRSLYAATKRVGANTYAGAFGALPGLSIPCGASSGGLPIGLMLEAPWWQEPLLLRAGHAYQQVTEWHKRRPVLPGA